MIKVHSCVHDVGGSAALWALGMGFNGQRHVGILPESYGISSQWLPRCPSAALRPTLIVIQVQVHGCGHDVRGSAALRALDMGLNGEGHSGSLPEPHRHWFL